MLTKQSLAQLLHAERRLLAPGEHIQVCLWFADLEEVESEDGYPEVWPVGGAEVTRHAAGGGVARGGDHIDFCIDSDDPRGSLELAGLLLDSAEEYAAENMSSPWDLACEDSRE